MNTDDILNQIDSTLEDWTVSGDAMRSRPGGTQRVFRFHVDTAEFDRQWQQLREQIIRAHIERARQVQVMFEAFRRAFTEVAKPAAEAAETFRCEPETVDYVPPPPPRDRPAWQSPYGPPRRRR